MTQTSQAWLIRRYGHDQLHHQARSGCNFLFADPLTGHDK
jgi:hypothetical protein